MSKEKSSFNKVAYNNTFIAKAYDRINLTVPKGQKEKIGAHAQKRGYKSINGYINHLIVDDMTSTEGDAQ